MDRVYPNNFKDVLDELEPLPCNWSRYDAHEGYLTKTEDLFHLNFQQEDKYSEADIVYHEEENEETESNNESKTSVQRKKGNVTMTMLTILRKDMCNQYKCKLICSF